MGRGGAKQVVQRSGWGRSAHTEGRLAGHEAACVVSGWAGSGRTPKGGWLRTKQLVCSTTIPIAKFKNSRRPKLSESLPQT